MYKKKNKKKKTEMCPQYMDAQNKALCLQGQ